jgi:hypothetical protein
VAKKNGRNYGVKLVKNWLNNKFERPYTYKRLIEELSNRSCEDIKANEAIHLVYDIFPEWHGVKVGSRAACYNREYMCEKIPDFRKHYKLIKSEFCLNPKKMGRIFFVWLGTSQEKACATFFCCLKKEFENIQLYYNPGGFVKKSKLEAWQYDCP